MENVCYDCRYKGICGDSCKECSRKEKFIRSSPDNFGFMEYIVESSCPYETIRCKSITQARKEAQKLKKQHKFTSIIGITQNGNDYIIKN